MTTAAAAVKDEQWGEAERALMEVQEIIGRLLREVADKAREKMLAPVPDVGDRGNVTTRSTATSPAYSACYASNSPPTAILMIPAPLFRKPPGGAVTSPAPSP